MKIHNHCIHSVSVSVLLVLVLVSIYQASTHFVTISFLHKILEDSQNKSNSFGFLFKRFTQCRQGSDNKFSICLGIAYAFVVLYCYHIDVCNLNNNHIFHSNDSTS